VTQSIKGGVTTRGSVTAVSVGSTCSRYGCTSYWVPTVEFTTTRGIVRTFTGPTSYSAVGRGQTVEVTYDPVNPGDAHELSRTTDYGGFVFGGLILAFVTWYMAFGLARVHRGLRLSSARPDTQVGWVGHRFLHSDLGLILAILVAGALALTGLFVL
jgi:hypothetical protein